MNEFTLIFGCMFSGKTTRLIEFYQASDAEMHEKIAVKPLIDNRYVKDKINAHSGLQMPGHRIAKPEEMITIVSDQTKEVYIDEIQFFSNNITTVIRDLMYSGIKVFASGLDKDYLGRDFGPMSLLKLMSNNKVELFAKCTVCQKQASYTYRSVESEDLFLVAHSDAYEARCEQHWKEGITKNTLVNQ